MQPFSRRKFVLTMEYKAHQNFYFNPSTFLPFPTNKLQCVISYIRTSMFVFIQMANVFFAEIKA